jgi:hypothetical protein
MSFELEVTYTGIPSETFVLDVFDATKELFSSTFELEYIGRVGDKYTYSILSKLLNDIYIAGMVGAAIEFNLKSN